MQEKAPRYINPYTDFGFKKLFGEEGSKHILKDFLNQLLPEVHKIKELTFKKTDNLPDIQTDRSAIFDVYCESENGSKFIVEICPPFSFPPLGGKMKGGQSRLKKEIGTTTSNLCIALQF